MKFSQKVLKMGNSPIRKFYKYALDAEKKGHKVYYLNIGQPDIATPRAFYDAVNNFSNNVLEYAPSPGIPSLIEEMKNYYHRNNINVSNEDILVTTGGSEAISIIASCIIEEGDEIIAFEPYYPNYSVFFGIAGANIVPVTTLAENGFHFEKGADIEAKITKKTRAIVVTSPGNPTGTILSKEEMRTISDIAKKHNLFIIADEVYREFTYDGASMASFGEFNDIDENLIIIDSISKRFSACGARIGAIVSKNKELIEHATKICQGRLSVATLDQVGATELYKLPADYFNDVKAEYEKRRDVVFNALTSIDGVICKKPAGAFYIIANLPIPDAEDFLMFLLTKYDYKGETLMYAPCESFYTSKGLGKNELRIAYVLKEEDLKKAMKVFSEGLKAYILK